MGSMRWVVVGVRSRWAFRMVWPPHVCTKEPTPLNRAAEASGLRVAAAVLERVWGPRTLRNAEERMRERCCGDGVFRGFWCWGWFVVVFAGSRLVWVGVDAGSALWLWGGGMLGGWWVGSGSVEV